MPRISHPTQRTPGPSALQRPIPGLEFTSTQRGARVNFLPPPEGGRGKLDWRLLARRDSGYQVSAFIPSPTITVLILMVVSASPHIHPR